MRISPQSRQLIGIVLTVALLMLSTIATPSLAAPPLGKPNASVASQPKQRRPAGPALRAQAKMSDEVKWVARHGKHERVDVIVQYNSRPSRLEASRAAALGARTKRGFQRLPMKVMNVPARALQGLAEGNRVRFVSLDQPVTGFSLSARQTAKVPQPGTPGFVPISTDINVAVLDSGIAIHSDLNVRGRVHIVSPATASAPGSSRSDAGLTALYIFDEGTGSTIYDRTNALDAGPALDLSLEDPATIEWLGNSLEVTNPTRFSASQDQNKIFEHCTATNEITVEAWIAPSSTGTTDLLASSLSHSTPLDGTSPWVKTASRYQFRLRTTTNGTNGMNSLLLSPAGTVTTSTQHVVATRNANGQAALYVDGQLVDQNTSAAT